MPSEVVGIGYHPTFQDVGLISTAVLTVKGPFWGPGRFGSHLSCRYINPVCPRPLHEGGLLSPCPQTLSTQRGEWHEHGGPGDVGGTLPTLI
jgi:hypothetical protein